MSNVYPHTHISSGAANISLNSINTPKRKTLSHQPFDGIIIHYKSELYNVHKHCIHRDLWYILKMLEEKTNVQTKNIEDLNTDIPIIESTSNSNTQLIENSGENKKSDFSKDALLLQTAIKDLTVEIKQLRNAIEQILKVKTDSMTVQKFIEKYNITLKLQNLNEFKDFEKRLTEDKQFLSDFKTSLKYLLEKTMYKTLLTILKKMFTRDLAIQFTVIRQIKNKYVIKETTFYKTLFDLVSNYCTNENEAEKEFNKTLGRVFNNARNWDGQRNVR